MEWNLIFSKNKKGQKNLKFNFQEFTFKTEPYAKRSNGNASQSPQQHPLSQPYSILHDYGRNSRRLLCCTMDSVSLVVVDVMKWSFCVNLISAFSVLRRRFNYKDIISSPQYDDTKSLWRMDGYSTSDGMEPTSNAERNQPLIGFRGYGSCFTLSIISWFSEYLYWVFGLREKEWDGS